MTTSDMIIERGSGPTVKGTRITVYSIIDYLLEGWPPERIAGLFGLRTNQVEAAIDYIREHTVEVLKEYLKVLERCERGNPPELQAELEASRVKLRQLVDEVRGVEARAKAEIADLIRRHREARAKENGDAKDHGGQ